MEENTSTNSIDYNEVDQTALEALISDDILIYSNTEEIEIYGTADQRKEMFADWAGYIGEVKNPDNTAVNPFFKKPGSNEGSLYSPLDEVLNNARPVLSKYGFGIFQSPTTKDSKVSVKTILVHKSGASINFPALTVPIAKNDAQGIIAGVTYARRGSLNPVLGTHGETDDDGNAASGNGSPQQDAKKATTPPKQQEKPKQPEDPTRGIKTEISAVAKSRGGSKNPEVKKIIDDNVGNGNFNSVTDMGVLNKIKTALEALHEPDKEEEKGNKE